MYLPKEVISNMLAHVSPLLNKLPLYLSSEYGVQKASQQLYLRVYKDYSPWRFKEWIHYGDNATSDGTKAKELGIKPQIHKIPKINAYETALINKIRNYDSYLLTNLLSRMRFNSINEKIISVTRMSQVIWFHMLLGVLEMPLIEGLKHYILCREMDIFLKKLLTPILV